MATQRQLIKALAEKIAAEHLKFARGMYRHNKRFYEAENTTEADYVAGCDEHLDGIVDEDVVPALIGFTVSAYGKLLKAKYPRK